MKPFGKEKLVLGERRKKATHQDKTKNRPIKFNLPRRHCSRATKREDEKEIFLETIVCVVIITRCCPHSIRTRASLQKEEKR